MQQDSNKERAEMREHFAQRMPRRAWKAMRL